MPNVPNRATGEAVSAVNDRAFLEATTSASIATAAAGITADPMLDLIARAEAWSARYSAAPFGDKDGEDEWLIANPDPAGDKLHSDPPVPTTLAGALAAVRFVTVDSGAAHSPHGRILRQALACLVGRAPDPLLLRVETYRQQLAAWEARGPDLEDDAFDALFVEMVEPAGDALANDPPVATTLAGAVAALQLVADRAKIGDWLAAPAVTTAALAFFDGSGRPASDPCLAFVTGWNDAMRNNQAICGAEGDAAATEHWKVEVDHFFRRCDDGDVPLATTAAGAAAALRRVLDWEEQDDQDTALIRAALGFLEGRAAR